MHKPIETVDDFLDEIVAYESGRAIRRRDTMAISRIQFLRENFPIIFAAGHDKGLREGLKGRKNG